MDKKQINVLVVDDSALMRELISDFISSQEDMCVAGTAMDGEQALRRIETIQPDVMTLDIQMPGMNGLEVLKETLKMNPIPTIMCSTLTQRGADITFDALDQGAMDYICKPNNSKELPFIKEELCEKIRSVANCDVKRILEIRKKRNKKIIEKKQDPKSSEPAIKIDSSNFKNNCIALGISTGGPPALTSLFTELKPPTPPIVVVQHMPAHFTKPFAWRLGSISDLEIKEAESGDILKPNHVYIAPGGRHLWLREVEGDIKVWIRDGDVVSGHRPSVDVMMSCVADLYGDRALGVIMTGMGYDGVDGCKKLISKGSAVLGQDEVSSEVYGMNKVAFNNGHVSKQFSLENAAVEIRREIKKLAEQEAVA